MKYIVAFDSFKGCMTANDACRAAQEGLLLHYPNAEVVCMPLSDGGEGMTDCLAACLDVKKTSVMVHDPLMRTRMASYLLSVDGKTAYMEMAATSGLTLISPEERNPLMTTTYGVGEMILDAQRRGCTNIIIGIGGSATCDGGKGMVECLRDYLPLDIKVTVASDVNNPLYGPEGAAYVFAPQKGASPEECDILDARLHAFADETVRNGYCDASVAMRAGTGAAGGLGYALMAYLGAEMTSGIDLMLDIIGFDEAMNNADMIITGEGKSDRQTLMGKVPMGVLQRAKQRGVPVRLYSGAIEDEQLLLNAGFADICAISDENAPLAEQLHRPKAMKNLKEKIKFHI